MTPKQWNSVLRLISWAVAGIAFWIALRGTDAPGGSAFGMLLAGGLVANLVATRSGRRR